MEEPFGRPFPPLAPGDFEPHYVPPPVPRRDRRWRHILLFALTFVSTTLVGGFHYQSFVRGFEVPPPTQVVEVHGVTEFLLALARGLAHDLVAVGALIANPEFMLSGLWYSVSILGILGCHEMGHYVACRRYGVDATLPFFLPAPLPLTGTLGAFIRIRSRIPSKKALFDIAFAGPFAGFVVAVPILFLGLAMSTREQLPEHFSGIWLGEPLLFRLARFLVIGNLPANMDVNMHPIAFAAWFGLLATALNLFPIGQLDGGHISHAVLGRRSSYVSLMMAAGAIGLTFLSASWFVWTLLIVLMLLAMGPHHPPTLDEDTPLDSRRRMLALFALVMLIVCFTPVPIEPFVSGE